MDLNESGLSEEETTEASPTTEKVTSTTGTIMLPNIDQWMSYGWLTSYTNPFASSASLFTPTGYSLEGFQVPNATSHTHTAPQYRQFSAPDAMPGNQKALNYEGTGW